MKLHKNLLITALGLLLSAASFADKQPSLIQQMWQFAYPDSNIPKQIPRNAKRAMADPYGNKQKDDVIFTNKENNDYYETITIDADYGNGYLLLHTRLADEERTFSYEVVAFKDSQGKYTFFKNNVSYLKGYGTGKCTIYPYGREFRSNRPLQKVFPKLTMQTFAPDISDKVSKDLLFYLDVRFPRKGTTVTASMKLLGRMHNSSADARLLYGDFGNNLDYYYPNVVDMRNELIDWAKQLSDKQSLNALMNGQALNSTDEQALKKMLQSYANSRADITQEMAKEKVIKILQWFNDAYRVEKHLKFSRIELAWDRKQGRFHVAKKIPAKQSTVPSFYDYLINLQKVEPLSGGWSYTCYDENYHGYGYIQ